MRQRILILSGHDFRTKRKANIHYIAEALAESYDVAFLSVGYSPLMRAIGGDPRISLEAEPNSWSDWGGVTCYLDKRVFYAGSWGGRVPPWLSSKLFKAFLRTTPEAYSDAIATADVIIVESGIAVLYLDKVLCEKGDAQVIYVASDDLSTIGVAPFLSEALERNISHIDTIRVPSERMATYFKDRGGSVCVIPHGLADPRRPSVGRPFGGGLHAVSVGSMLFDPTFFELAAQHFPEIQFHIIGSGSIQHYRSDNIIVYPEMAHEETLAFLNHADIGVAAYRDADAPYYLCDTSMKLMQYQALNLPAVCPYYAVGGKAGRFGYTPNDPASIKFAVSAALGCERNFYLNQDLTWAEVARRIINASTNSSE